MFSQNEDVKPPQVKEEPETVETKQEPMETEEKKPEIKTEPKEEEGSNASGTTPSGQSSQSRKKSKNFLLIKFSCIMCISMVV